MWDVTRSAQLTLRIVLSQNKTGGGHPGEGEGVVLLGQSSSLKQLFCLGMKQEEVVLGGRGNTRSI